MLATWYLIDLAITQFYHYFLSFDDEVSQIWPQPTWKTGKIVFLATRYAGIVYVTSLLVGKYTIILAKLHSPISALTEGPDTSQLAASPRDQHTCVYNLSVSWCALTLLNRRDAIRWVCS